MAISLYPVDRVREEIQHLEERIRAARSRDEYEYFRDRLRDLEHRSRGMLVSPPPWINDPPPTIKPAPKPEVTPLSFLNNIEKKVLLT